MGPPELPAKIDGGFASRFPASFAVGIDPRVACDCDGNEAAVRVFSADHDEIANAALSYLAFDGRYPRAFVSVFSDAMQENAGIANGFAFVGLLAPSVFSDQTVIPVTVFRAQIPRDLAGNPQHSIRHRKNALGVVMLCGFEPRIELRKTGSIEQLNDLAWNDRVGLWFRNCRCCGKRFGREYEKDDQPEESRTGG